MLSPQHRHEPEEEAWREQAACRGMDVEVFFPDHHGARKAKAICAQCPVQLDCLEYALVNKERFGVWGKKSEQERRRVRRTRRIRLVD